MKNYIYAVLLLCLTSCVGFLEEVPTTSLSEETVYSTEYDLEAGVIGCYASMRGGGGWQGELEAGAEVNADEMYESVFTYEKDGIQETFTLGHLPDSTWTFISVDTRLKSGYEESLTGLSFYDPQTGEYMDNLAIEGKVMVISAYRPDMRKGKWDQAEAFASRASEAGFTTLLLCASQEGIPDSLLDSAYISDYKTLVSLNRSNGGITYFHNGQLIRKWASSNIPDDSQLRTIAETDPTEIAIGQDNKGSLVFQGFLLYVSAVMLLL